MSDASQFGLCLRHERERRRISLASIAVTTKIGTALLEGLERDDLSRWPAGIFRRSFVRAYAEAIGLDGDEVVREFLERFPDPDEIVAAPEDPQAAARGSHAHLHLRIVGIVDAFRRGHVLDGARRRWAAVACDAGVLLLAACLVFAIGGRFWEALGIVAFGYYGGGILFLGNTPGVCLFARDATDQHG